MSQIDLENDLLNFIIESDHTAGDRLPTISALKDELGIGTSKIREQLEVARVLGLVDVKSRTGTRLKPYRFAPAVRLSLFYALAQDPRMFPLFSELRKHIETAFWHEACAVLRPADHATMRQCVEQAQHKLTGDWIRIPHAEHRTFHMTVFRRLENPFVVGLLEVYWDAYEAIHLNTYSDYDYLQSVWTYHEKILDAIDADDIDRAQALFIEHTRLLRRMKGAK
jgi:DNA-binding FadR family transcriptional regulator